MLKNLHNKGLKYSNSDTQYNDIQKLMRTIELIYEINIHNKSVFVFMTHRE